MALRRWLDTRSLRWRVWALAVIGALALLVVAGLVASRLAEIRTSAQQVLAVLEPASDRSAELVVSVSDMDRSVLAYVLSGAEADATAYGVANRRSALALDRLESLLGDDADIGPQIDRVRAERAAWIEVAARPALEQMRAGEQAAAAATMTAEAARTAYAVLDADATALDGAINDERTAQFERLEQIALQLVWVLVGSGVVLLALLAAGVIALRRWVTHPLRELQTQLAGISADQQRVITPGGPPELYAVGVDAEAMRRRLLAQIDTAEAAEGGLLQHAPAVAEIRAWLAASPDAIDGVAVLGQVQPAEGVLAGDWWDVVRLPDGRAGIVMADVGGHGSDAGVAAVALKGALLGALHDSAPADALAAADAILAEDEGRIATAVVVVVSPATGEIVWANAGHHPPLLARAAGPVDRLAPTGPLLTGLELGPWREGRDRLADDDVLLLYTDGLLESHGADGSELGDEGLLALVERARAGHGGEDPAELVARVVAGARERAADWRRDDVTVVAVARALTRDASGASLGP